MMHYNATIHDNGNGIPSAGGCVSDGERLYRVIRMSDQRPGRPVYATVEPAERQYDDLSQDERREYFSEGSPAVTLLGA